MLVTQESRRKAQEVDWGGNQSWAAVYQSIAIRMLSHLDNSEALKVSTEELKEQVLSPNEPSVNIERIARPARSEKGQGAKEILVAMFWSESAWTLVKQLSM